MSLKESIDKIHEGVVALLAHGMAQQFLAIGLAMAIVDDKDWSETTKMVETVLYSSEFRAVLKKELIEAGMSEPTAISVVDDLIVEDVKDSLLLFSENISSFPPNTEGMVRLLTGTDFAPLGQPHDVDGRSDRGEITARLHSDAPREYGTSFSEAGAGTRRTRGSRWTRKELLTVLHFYIKHKEELATPQNHPLTEKLAIAMGRTNASIAMRIANYRSEDPAYPGRGLEGGGPYIEIWREYEGAPDRLLAEARRAYQEFIPGDAR